jgi:hypothetical protein
MISLKINIPTEKKKAGSIFITQGAPFIFVFLNGSFLSKSKGEFLRRNGTF